MKHTLSSLFLPLISLYGLAAFATEASPDPQTFVAPPDQYGVGAYWFWLNGNGKLSTENVSKEGITKDMEAMRDQGIVRAVWFDVQGTAPAAMGDEWFAMIKHAAAEANRLGIKLSMQACPGWSELGGPWIPIESSMKRLVWSQTIQKGGTTISMDLPALPAEENWSKDVAVLAWPADRSSASRMEGVTCVSNGVKVAGDCLWDGNPFTGVGSGSDKHLWGDSGKYNQWNLEFSFPALHKTDHLKLHFRWDASMYHHSLTSKVSVRIAADGKVVLEKEIEGKELDHSLTIPFEPVVGKQFNVALAVKAPASAFRFMQISEAEFLDGMERPQWDPGILNIAPQMGDGAEVNTPVWTEEKEGPQPMDPQKIVDLSKFVKGGRLQWTAPAGNWRIVRFGFTTTGSINHPATGKTGTGFETDKMSATVTELHVRSYVKPVLNAAGKNRSAFDILWADSWEAGKQNWTDDFPEQFSKRRGYAIWPHLAVAAGEIVGSRQETVRFLNDFRLTISDLIVEGYYGKMAELAHAEGMKFASEYGYTPDLDIFAIARSMDMPATEFWSDNNEGSILEIPKEIRTTSLADAAFLAGKSILPEEAFTAWTADFRRTPGDYAYLGDIAFCTGMNGLILHYFGHQPVDKPPGLTLGQHGQAFNRLNTWWPMMGDWLLSLRRTQYLLQSSEPVYDVMVYCGDSMPSPSDIWGLPKEVRRLRIDHQALMNRLNIQDGRLTLDGKGNYAAILFPNGTLLAETVEKIASLVSKGVTVGVKLPFQNASWSDHEAQDIRLEAAARSILGDVGKPVLPRAVGKGKVCPLMAFGEIFKNYKADFISTGNGGGKSLFSYHKTNGDADIFLMFNPNDKQTSFSCDVADAGGRIPEIWDRDTGKIAALPDARHENGRVIFPLTLEGKSSSLLVLRKEASANAKPVAALGTPRELALSENRKVVFTGLPELSATSLKSLESWTENSDPRIQNYSGIGVYEIKFTVPKGFLADVEKVRIDLGEVSRVARVTMNGRKLGTLWRAPWRLDADGSIKEGENTLKVEVANTWLNRMLADTDLPQEKRQTQTTWLTAWWKNKNAQAEKSGLLGDVRLLAYPTIVGSKAKE